MTVCFLKSARLLSSLSCRRCFSLGSKLRGLELDDTIEKSTMSIGSADGPNVFQPTGLFVGGFIFGLNTVIGSIAMLPGTVFQWTAESVQDINEESLSLFSVTYPPIELIVIGTGTRIQPVHPKVIKAMRKRGISLEVQDTRNACGTYNLLQKERPNAVGGAMLPLTEMLTSRIPSTAKQTRLPADHS